MESPATSILASFYPSPSPNTLLQLCEASDFAERHLISTSATESDGGGPITSPRTPTMLSKRDRSTLDADLSPGAVDLFGSCKRPSVPVEARHSPGHLTELRENTSSAPVKRNDSPEFVTPAPRTPGSGLKRSVSRSPNLETWGIPALSALQYEESGIRELYQWQRECLMLDGVMQGKNLVYSAPTSGGKTLVAELLMMKRLRQAGSRDAKALFVLPLVSVVQEKTTHLQRVFGAGGFQVHAFCAGSGFVEEFINGEVDVAVCTIEKANSIINTMIDTNQLHKLSCVVIDEAHMIAEQDRGYLIELILTKLRFLLADRVQIVCMSATLPNIHTLSDWLQAAVYQTEFRPVPLQISVCVNNQVLDSCDVSTVIRTLDVDLESKQADQHKLALLCEEVMTQGHGVVVFCATKRQCESVCRTYAKDPLFINMVVSSSPSIQAQRIALATSLQALPGGSDPLFQQCIPAGIAFHHAGLTQQERVLIEGGFRNGTLLMLAATSTLAAGVNLPARRVILKSPYVGCSFMDDVHFRQMCGRAGRAGQHNVGEAIVMVQEKDLLQLQSLFSLSTTPLTSALCVEKRGLTRSILEVVAVRAACDMESIGRFCECSLLSATSSKEALIHATHSAIRYLLQHGFIEYIVEVGSTPSSGRVQATNLGLATVMSLLGPEEGLFLFEELEQASSAFVLNTELHLIYHITPAFSALTPKWKLFKKLLATMDSKDKLVAQRAGISYDFIAKAADSHEFLDRKSPDMILHCRFFTALILFDLVQEVSIDDICKKYSLPRGQVQGLQQSASSFAALTQTFCEKLNWFLMATLVAHIIDRLSHGVQHELLPLVQIPHVKSLRARALYNAGYRTVRDVSLLSLVTLEEILTRALPYECITGDDSDRERALNKEKKVSRLIIQAAKDLCGQQGLTLQQEQQIAISRVYDSPSQSLHLQGKVTPFSSGVSRKISPQPTPQASSAPRAVLPPPLPQPSAASFSTPQPAAVNNADLQLSAGLIGKSTEKRIMNAEAPPPPPPLLLKSALSSGSNDGKKKLTPNTPSRQVSFDENSLMTSSKRKAETKVITTTTIATAEPAVSSASVLAVEQNKRVKRGPLFPLSKPDNDANISVLVEEEESSSIPSSVLLEPVLVPSVSEEHVIIASPDKHLQPQPMESESDNTEIPRHWNIPAPSRRARGATMPRLTTAVRNSNQATSSLLSSAAAVPLRAESPVAFPDSPLTTVKHSVPVVPVPPTIIPVAASSVPTDATGASVSVVGATPRVYKRPNSRSLVKAHTLLPSPTAVNTLPTSKPPVVAPPIGISSGYSSSVNTSVLQKALAPPLPPVLPMILTTASKPSVSMAVTGVIPAAITGMTVIREAAHSQWKEFVEVWQKEKRFAFMICTKISAHSSDSMENGSVEISGLAIKFLSGLVYFTSLTSTSDPRWEDVRLLMGNKQTEKIAPLFQDQLALLLRYNVDVRGRVHDAAIAEWMLEPDEKSNVKVLNLPVTAMDCYNRLETVIKQVTSSLQKLQQNNLLSIYTENEMPFTRVLADMKHHGIGFDDTLFVEWTCQINKKLSWIEDEAAKLRGGRRVTDWKVSSELSDILYEELMLPVMLRTPKTGKPSTAQEALEPLIALHPFPGLVIEYRKLVDLRGDLEALARYAMNGDGDTKRIYAVYDQTSTSTGRLAVRCPNLQTLTHAKSFFPVSSDGKNLSKEEITVKVRDGIVAKEGCLLVAADYAQLEMRIMAHLSEDKELLRIFAQGDDPFLLIAAELRSKPVSGVSPAERVKAKQMCYGILYGQGVKCLSKSMGVSLSEAQAYQETFLARFSGVHTFFQKTVDECRKNGYVTTAFGRKRYLPAIVHEDRKVRSHAERQAKNTVCQGSAADLVKAAMIHIHRRIELENLTGNMRLVLQIHDELLFEVDRSRVQDLKAIIVRYMQEAPRLLVPLPVKMSQGTSWGSLY